MNLKAMKSWVGLGKWLLNHCITNKLSTTTSCELGHGFPQERIRMGD